MSWTIACVCVVKGDVRQDAVNANYYVLFIQVSDLFFWSELQSSSAKVRRLRRAYKFCNLFRNPGLKPLVWPSILRRKFLPSTEECLMLCLLSVWDIAKQNQPKCLNYRDSAANGPRRRTRRGSEARTDRSNRRRRTPAAGQQPLQDVAYRWRHSSMTSPTDDVADYFAYWLRRMPMTLLYAYHHLLRRTCSWRRLYGWRHEL